MGSVSVGVYGSLRSRWKGNYFTADIRLLTKLGDRNATHTPAYILILTCIVV